MSGSNAGMGRVIATALGMQHERDPNNPNASIKKVIKGSSYAVILNWAGVTGTTIEQYIYSINLSAQNTLKAVVGIYVDNSFNPNDVKVFFPSSGWSTIVEGFSGIIVPIVSNGLDNNVQITCEGGLTTVLGHSGTYGAITTIFFNDFYQGAMKWTAGKSPATGYSTLFDLTGGSGYPNNYNYTTCEKVLVNTTGATAITFTLGDGNPLTLNFPANVTVELNLKVQSATVAVPANAVVFAMLRG